MLTIKSAIIASWILATGLFVAYPRYRPLSDLPGPYSMLLQEYVSNRDHVENKLAKRRQSIASRGGDVTIGTPDEVAILQWWYSTREDIRRKFPLVTQAHDMSSEQVALGHKAAAKEEWVVGVVITAQDSMRYAKATATYARVSEEIKRQLLAGSLSRNRARKQLWIADMATRKGLDKELRLTLRALQDPLYARRLVESRLSGKPMAIIESHRDGLVKGYLVDRARTVVLPFSVPDSGVPRTIAVELRCWDAAKGVPLRGLWLASFLGIIVLMPIERYLAWKARRHANSMEQWTPSAHASYKFIRDRVDSLRARKTPPLESRRDTACPSPTTWRALWAGDEAYAHIAVGIASVLLCLAIWVWGNPAPTEIDTKLTAFVHSQILKDTFTIVRYDRGLPAESPVPGRGLGKRSE